MSNIYLLHRVSVIQRTDNKDNEHNKDNMENADTGNTNEDDDNVDELFTSFLEVATEMPTDVPNYHDVNPTIQRRISYTNGDFATQSERVKD